MSSSRWGANFPFLSLLFLSRYIVDCYHYLPISQLNILLHVFPQQTRNFRRCEVSEADFWQIWFADKSMKSASVVLQSSPLAVHTGDLLTHNCISLVCRVPLDPSRLQLLHMLVTARLSVSGAALHSIMHFGSTPADVPKRSEIFSLRGALERSRLVSGGDPCLWLRLKDGLNFWVDPDHEWITGEKKITAAAHL